MANVKIEIPGFGENEGEAPIVILGPNGSGKTQFAQKITHANKANGISAQRRTWVDDSLPVQEERNLLSNLRSQQEHWHNYPWQPTEDLNFILSKLVQEHTNLLTQRNELAIASAQPLQPVNDTKLILLQGLWSRLFPKRKLEIGGFFPKVRRLDAEVAAEPYELRRMSDGERTVLYMAARILTAEQTVLVVDEPELHMHSRLSVQFWDEAEKLRPDCRFVYITHDLNFTLSRRGATVLIARSSTTATPLVVDGLPSSIAAEVLGAATLPFFARRIFLYEGESGKGFASELFSAWFDGDDTFAIASGDRSSVCAAVSGLKTVGVVAAEVVGLVDRDFDSDEVLKSLTQGVVVLPVHEIESVLCDREVVGALAGHFGKDPNAVWAEFLDQVRKEFRSKTLSALVARRVRSRIGDLLSGAFDAGQIEETLADTSSNHAAALNDLNLPGKVVDMFAEEGKRVDEAVSGELVTMLAILPGKHMLAVLARVFALKNTSDLTSLVLRSLNRNASNQSGAFLALGAQLEGALGKYLPARRTP